MRDTMFMNKTKNQITLALTASAALLAGLAGRRAIPGTSGGPLAGPGDPQH